ncbi:MAG: methylated-DNA--[protein]-cysteine S-methyltransferase [Planctomycetes bacterium]|jgi:O-6-methylguanine DNA methyltransferase|nr:methylated-DNA--[protein]-cysteine S-methyltransferase [Planctomycetota bacterium]
MSHTTVQNDEQLIRRGQIRDGMTFMQRTWALCARIPRGSIATYGDLARALGAPGAARAVGLAMARNPDAPAVPCHRVVGADGSLHGFQGGLAKKAALLRAEGVPIVDGKADLACRHRFAR